MEFIKFIKIFFKDGPKTATMDFLKKNIKQLITNKKGDKQLDKK